MEVAQRRATRHLGRAQPRIFSADAPARRQSAAEDAGEGADRPHLGRARLRQPRRRVPPDGSVVEIRHSRHCFAQCRSVRPASADRRGRPEARMGVSRPQPHQRRVAERDTAGRGTRLHPLLQRTRHPRHRPAPRRLAEFGDGRNLEHARPSGRRGISLRRRLGQRRPALSHAGRRQRDRLPAILIRGQRQRADRFALRHHRRLRIDDQTARSTCSIARARNRRA